MITLSHFPKNNAKFLRLVELFKEVLDICSELDIPPVLSGSLAAFAYTGDPEMNVNDVDLSCSESEFPKIINILEQRGIHYKLREWHVLQILRDDLKVELDSTEYWYNDLPMDCETLQVDSCRVKILCLDSLIEFYRRGMRETVERTDENGKAKYTALKAKYEALERIKE